MTTNNNFNLILSEFEAFKKWGFAAIDNENQNRNLIFQKGDLLDKLNQCVPEKKVIPTRTRVNLTTL